MGLDNGIVVKGINKEDIPSFVKLPFGAFREDELEIVYWRKCWGIRGDILDILHGEDSGYSTVNSEDIPAIIKKAIMPYCCKETWDRDSNSIWEFEQIFPQLIQCIINLTWLKDYMEYHPEVTCYFYDSY